MNWRRLSASEEKFVVSLSQKFRAARIGRRQQQKLPFIWLRGVADESMQLSVAADKLVPRQFRKNALMTHRKYFAEWHRLQPVISTKPRFKRRTKHPARQNTD